MFTFVSRCVPSLSVLFRHFFLYPLLTASLVAGLLWLFGQPWKYLQLGFVCAWIWHSFTLLAFSLWMSRKMGHIAGFWGGLLSGLLLCGMQYGVVSILAASLFSLGVVNSTLLHQPTPTDKASLGQDGFAALSHLLLAALLLFGGYALSTPVLNALPPDSLLNPLPLRLSLIAGVVMIFLGALSAGVRGVLYSGLLLMSSFGLLVTQAYWWPGDSASEGQYILLDGINAAVLAMLSSGLYALAYVPAQRQYSTRAAIWAGNVFALSSMSLITYFIAPLWHIAALFAGLFLGWSHTWWRPLLLYPVLEIWHSGWLLHYQHRVSPPTERDLKKHAAFWDSWQFLPWRSLLPWLLWIQQQDAALARKGLQQLEHSPQHGVIAAFNLILNLKTLAEVRNLEQMAQVHQQLQALPNEHAAHTFLQRFQTISRDVTVVNQQGSHYAQRLILHDTEERLDRLIMDLSQYPGHIAKRLLPLGLQWRDLLTAAYAELEDSVNLLREIHNPYVVGIPLTSQQDIFVGRHDIIADIEKCLLTTPAPPVLVYGQRRTGKTSLLSNLSRLLPSRFVFAYLDFQSPRMLSGQLPTMLEGIVFSVTRALRNSWQHSAPALDKSLLDSNPLHAFALWLEAVETLLHEHTLILALDEFVALEDKPMAQNTLHELLSLFRHLIQHHPKWRLMLAGSHQLDELNHWAGYLVNVQVLHLGGLAEPQARQLITHPMADFPLQHSEATVARLLALSSGHPALLQLLCRELVSLKNSQAESQRYQAQLEDIEQAAVNGIKSGLFYFSDMLHNQIKPDALAVLRYLAAQGERAVLSHAELAEPFEDIEARLQQLLRRELVMREKEGYRFSVELVRRAVLTDHS